MADLYTSTTQVAGSGTKSPGNNNMKWAILGQSIASALGAMGAAYAQNKKDKHQEDLMRMLMAQRGGMGTSPGYDPGLSYSPSMLGMGSPYDVLGSSDTGLDGDFWNNSGSDY